MLLLKVLQASALGYKQGVNKNLLPKQQRKNKYELRHVLLMLALALCNQRRTCWHVLEEGMQPKITLLLDMEESDLR